MANVWRSDPQSGQNVQGKLEHSHGKIAARANLAAATMSFTADTNYQSAS
jgi:hypothetical protein